MSRAATNVQTLFVSASVLALAVSARPMAPNVILQMGTQAQQVSFDLLSHLPSALSDATPATDKTEHAEVNAVVEDSAGSGVKDVLDHLVELAGKAPASLVEWAASHGKTGAAASVPSTNNNDEATIFVFTASDAEHAGEEQTVRVAPERMSRIIIPPGSGGTPMEVVFTDAPPAAPMRLNGDVAVAGDAVGQEAQPSPKSPAAAKALAELSPYMAPTMLALLSLGIVFALIAVYHAMFSTPAPLRRLTPADIEANEPDDKTQPSGGDKEKSASVATAEEKAAADLAEKILHLMPPAGLGRTCSPRRPHMVPLPEDDETGMLSVSSSRDALSRSPSPYLTPRQSVSEEQLDYFPDPDELELLIDVAAQALPQLSRAMPGSLDSQVFSESFSLEDVAGLVRSTGPEPILPLQIALLFPYVNEGWLLKFFVVLFGWWSVVLSPRSASVRGVA